jgi:hypothetical protein
MTAIPQPNFSRGIPASIRTTLRAVATRQWKLAAARGALQSLLVVLAVLLAASILLGFVTVAPDWLRIPVAAITWTIGLAAAARFLRPMLRRRSLTDAAFVVERHVPGLDERISSAVELSSEHETFAGSPLLVRHLVRRAEADAAAVKPEAILPSAAVRKLALWLIPLALLWLTLSVVAPRALFAGLYRVLLPWRDHLPALLADVVVTPGDVTLAEGDALEVKATVNVRSGPDRPAARALLLTRDAGADRTLSRDLPATATRSGEFNASLPDVHQSFSYSVSTDRGDSPWFTATVLPRPAVAQLDVRYDYPAYTGMDRREQLNSDGAIKAIQGTEVTLTIHCADALDLSQGRSRVAIAEGTRQREAQLRPLEGKPNVYEAKLTVFNSGSYRIRLVNRHGLENKDDQPRPIVAEFDQAPKVAIASPQSDVTVRGDDDVPVTFAASDDFGVAKVQAMVQVDDKPAEAADVNLARGGADRRRVEVGWVLSVPAHVARAGVSEAKTITYWLKATDNRDPDPQSAESARQTLKIDNGQPLAYRTRVEQQQAKDLMQAIDRAIQRLQQSEWPINSLRDIDRGRTMNADEKNRAKEQREQLAKTSEDLADAAESNLKNSYSAVAARAKEIAESPIRGAAENVARSLLSADQAEPRTRAAAEAAAQMADARKQLEELKKQVDSRSKQLEAARELEKLAKKQTELAKAQPKAAEKPRDAEQKRQREQTQQRQRELAERLQRTIGQSEALQEAKAAEQAVRLRELIDRVEQLQKDQSPLKKQLAKQEETARLQGQAEDLARRQEELNDAIERFAADRRSPLQRADTRAPDANHQAAILDRLRQNDPQQAQDLQRQSVDQLKQAAKQLEERGRSRDLRPSPAEQLTIQQREQAKQAAQQSAEQAHNAAEQLRQAKESKNADQLAQAKKAVDSAAETLTQQARSAAAAVADAAASDDATAKKNADEAKQAAEAAQAAADAARRAAQQADAQATAGRLEEAAKQLARAQEEALDATQADLLADQRSASTAAAGQAKELAARQAELADASKQAARALEPARRDQQSPQDVANRQNQLKDQTQQAAQQADQLEQLANPTNPALARRAAAAEALLREAAAAEAQAAQSEQSVAQAQQQAEQAMQQAAKADQKSATLDEQSAQAAGESADQQQQADAAQQQSADAQARKDEPAAKALAQQATQAKQQAEKQQKQAEELKRQAAAAERRAKESAKRADAARDSAAAARQQSQGHQVNAEQALARAEDALRDIDRMTADAQGRPDPSQEKGPSESSDAQPRTDAEPQAQASADAQSPDAPPGKSGGSPSSPPPSPEQAMRQAAQGAQEAVQAQQQAVSNNADSGAIRQAAAALQQAAAAMAAATATGEASASSVAGADEQAETGGEVADANQTASARAPSRDLDSRTGTGTGAGTHDGRPQSVQELGVSAGDWARLGPLQRQDLLNAAQQSGPPAYREMIKNYYVRIARFGRDGEPQASSPKPQ